MELKNHNCQEQAVANDVAAYLDGQFEAAQVVEFEAHLENCAACREELNAQRQFLCALDSSFSHTEQLPIPKDFARIVAARAESDMSRVRQTAERRRALLVCLTLGVTAFALLGATTDTALLLNGRALANKVFGVLSLLWTTLRDAYTGLSIVSRVVAQLLLPQSPVMSFAALILLALAIASLSHLIIKYHRRSQMRLFD